MAPLSSLFFLLWRRMSGTWGAASYKAQVWERRIQGRELQRALLWAAASLESPVSNLTAINSAWGGYYGFYFSYKESDT